MAIAQGSTAIPRTGVSTRSPSRARPAARITSCERATKIVAGDDASIGRTVELLSAGGIVAVKGLGGYHLACDARNADGGEILARSEVSQGEALRADGPRTSRLLANLWNSRPKRSR